MAAKLVHICTVIAAYCIVSIAMVFGNKFLVGNHSSDQDISIFVVWAQCGTAIAYVFCVNLIKSIRNRQWTRSNIRMDILKIPAVLKTTLTFVCSMSLNNLCLKHVGVSFYQVARSLTLIFVAGFSVLILKRLLSWRVSFSCVIVVMGFTLGIDQENLIGPISIRGVSYGVAASVFAALNGIYIQQALDELEGDSTTLTISVTMFSAVLMLPLVALTGQAQEALMAERYQNLTFWLFICGTGVLSFVIAWLSAVQIHLTSPLSHHIIGNTKSVFQTLVAVIYYNESKPVLWWVSILLVICGTTSYAVVRMQEQKTEHPHSASKHKEEPGPEDNTTLMSAEEGLVVCRQVSR